MAAKIDIDRKQDHLLHALLTEPGVDEAAKKAGVSSRTAYRYLADEDFQQKYAEARRQAVKQAIASLQGAMSQAVEALRLILSDREASPNARVAAARTLLDLGLKATETEDLAGRVAALEKEIHKFSSACAA